MQLVAGVDEVGRGALAGPVVSAVVVSNKQILGDDIIDSKLLSIEKRAILANIIKQRAVAWAIGQASSAEVDNLNIAQATLLSMQRAVLNLSNISPSSIDLMYIDGNLLPDMSEIL